MESPRIVDYGDFMQVGRALKTSVILLHWGVHQKKLNDDGARVPQAHDNDD
jgi:hypothetical protein